MSGLTVTDPMTKKMKNIKRYALWSVMLAVAGGVSAQESLQKEITVEREIVPEVRAASRLNLYPRTLVFPQTQATLSFSELTETADMEPRLATLEPASTGRAIPLTPYRGYVDLGYFPLANGSLSAGYALVQTDATRLNVWGQADNTDYKARPADDAAKMSVRRFAATAGLDFIHSFGETGTLTAATSLTYNNFTRPDAAIPESFSERSDVSGRQNVLAWDVSAGWESYGNRDLSYHVRAGFGLMDFGHGIMAVGRESAEPERIKAAGERTFNFGLGVEKRLYDNGSFGADFEADIAHNIGGWGTSTPGVLSLAPYFRCEEGVLSLKAGVNLGFALNSGKVFHIAPDVLLGLNPASGFGMWLRCEGGERLNTLRSLFEVTPYMSPVAAYTTSGMPVKGDLGLRFGPVKGAALVVKLSYGMANRWLMPEAIDNRVVFFGRDLRAWKISAEAVWDYRDMVSLRACYAGALGSEEKQTWMEWRDRARHVVSAAVTVRPMSPLAIDLSYELRMRRRMPFVGSEGEEWFNLKNESRLNAGLSYRVSDAFTVFMRGENLLNCRNMLMPFVPSQGITGLVGAGLKF